MPISGVEDPSFSLTERLALGVAYYPEYVFDGADIDSDFVLMVGAGITVIRVGESTWSTWEPREGEFRAMWMRDVLDAAARYDIEVILGTPSYAVPPWLALQHPEIVGVDVHGRALGWGGRQEMDLTAPAYREHARRITALVVEEFRDHPAVIGYQIDNEPGANLLYNDSVVALFRTWLARNVGSAAQASDDWGLDYWSHRLTDWNELWRPETNKQPQYDLAWRLFQSEIVADFIDDMADTVRSLARPGQFLTTCVAHDRPAADDLAIGMHVDIAAGNAYYRMQDSFAHPAPVRPQTWMSDGAWSITTTADRIYGATSSPFLVTETNAGPINDSDIEEPGWDGQWRQAAWSMFMRGARLTGYWHWNTTRAGTETYWGGILPHDGRPGRVYRNIAALGEEVLAIGPLIAATRPDSDMGILFSTASKYALAHQAVFPGENAVDGRSYLRIVESFTRAGFTAGRQARVIHDRSLADHPLDPSSTPLLIVPALYAADDDTLDALREYAERGGHLVVGPRTAVAAGWAVVRDEVKPARLAEAAGVSYQEFSTLDSPVPIVGRGPLAGCEGSASDWLEMLESRGADVLATYVHPQFGDYAAVTSHSAGSGRVTVIGTLIDDDMYSALFDWFDRLSGTVRPVLPSAVTSSSATSGDGSYRVHALFNWSWQPVEVDTPSDWRTIVGDYDRTLGPWGVRISTESLQQGEAL